MRRHRPLLAALLVVALISEVAHSAEDGPVIAPIATQTDTEPTVTYWRRNREGWFWYRDPPEPAARPNAIPAPPTRPRELVDFEAMQKRLEELKRVAVMNPTDGNLLAYMRYQRLVMNKSEQFAERWQRLVWTVPELDYGLTGRPTNTMAINAFDEQQRDRQAQTVRHLAATHGLLFIFRSDCPYCHRFAPILKRFEQAFGMTVFAVSLDGGSLPEFPNAPPDNGLAARLNASVVPALYLTAPATRDIRPVGFGVMALNELVERIAAIATAAPDNPL
jgi:conjugal transfer pilus assembly protein TraF